MDSLPASKTRQRLSVEALEDRRLLSQFGAMLPWEGLTRPTDSQVETAPMVGGPVASRADDFDGPIADRGRVAPENPPGFDSGNDVWQTPFGAEKTAESVASDCALPVTTMPVSTASATNVSAESVGVSPISGNDSSQKPISSSNDSPGAPSVGFDARESNSQPVASPQVFVAAALPPRATPSSLAPRGVSELLQTSAHADVSSTTSTPDRAVSDETLPAVASVVGSPSGTSSVVELSRGGTALVQPGAPGLQVGQVVTGTVVSPSPTTGLTETPTPPGLQVGPGIDGEGTESQASFEPLVETRFGEPAEIEAAEPALAGLIQSFLPFDRLTVENAIDQILEPFDGLSLSMPELRGPMGMIIGSLAAAASVVAVEVALRIRRSREGEQVADEGESLDLLPAV